MANWKSDPAHGFSNKGRAGVSHVVGGAPGFKSGKGGNSKSDPPAGFHGKGTSAKSHFASGPTRKMGSRNK